MFASAFLLETVLNFKSICQLAVFSDAFKHVMNCYQLLPSKYLYSVICYKNIMLVVIVCALSLYWRNFICVSWDSWIILCQGLINLCILKYSVKLMIAALLCFWPNQQLVNQNLVLEHACSFCPQVFYFILFYLSIHSHSISTTCCCMINAVHSKAAVNSGGREQKIYLSTHAK